MTEHDKPSADEREAIRNIALHISGLAGTGRLGVAVVAAGVVLAERRDADRRVEEARAKAIEQCARVCEVFAPSDDDPAAARAAVALAAGIRALAAQAPPRDDATQP